MLNNDARLWIQLNLTTRLDRLTRHLYRSRFADHFKSVETVCLFVGYPRSGHSLVGSVLDAHPHALISHRVNAAKYLKAGYCANDIFYMMLKNSRRFATAGRELTGYAYHVPGQWHGRCEMLKVIGDQEARGTTQILGRDLDLLQRLVEAERPRVSFIHVIRNPYDNISTWAQRSRSGLSFNITRYFALCELVAEIKRRCPPARFLDVRHERFVLEFGPSLDRMMSFLGLRNSPEFTQACASIVHAAPHISRHGAPWTPTLIEEVQRRMSPFAYLREYSFDG